MQEIAIIEDQLVAKQDELDEQKNLYFELEQQMVHFKSPPPPR